MMWRHESLRCWAAVLALPAVLFAGGQTGVASTVTYSYDALGRLVVAHYPDGGCTGYQYDAAGNRTQYTSSSATAVRANGVSVTTYQDIASIFDPRVNDPSCTALAITAVTAPRHGTAAVANGGTAIRYVPSPGFIGRDSFTYTVSAGQSATGGVAVTVTPPTLPPLARNGQRTVTYHIIPPQKVRPIVSQVVPPLVSDPYGYGLRVSSFTQGAHGRVTYEPVTHRLTYIYDRLIGTNKEVADNFAFTVTDDHGRTATANIAVGITVKAN